MPSNYNEIREDNLREYGHGTRHLSHLDRLYPDRTHFIFELLQNAEDAGASKVLFQLSTDRLHVLHDGRIFNEKDVRGICGVGEGTKTEDLMQIGKFGIGFKSVYAYTASPEVHSGDEHFKIEHYVRPYAIQQQRIGDSWTTLFIFPFNKRDVEPATACREISTRLHKLSARTLLFLRQIEEVEYSLPDGKSGVYLRGQISRDGSRDGAREVTVIGQNNGAEESESWLIFKRPVEVPAPPGDCPRQVPVDQVRVEIGFRLQKNEKEQGEEVVRVKDSPLVVFFPTEKETRFGFLIQGPYKTTPARDNILEKDDWNGTLVRETAYLIADVLPQLKDLGLLGVSLLEALPIRPGDFPENGVFYPIYAAVQEALKTRELLPADDGSFVSAKNAKLARGADLRKLLDHEQLRTLFESEDAVKWLAGSITQDRTPDLRTYLLNELKVEEITPESFARKITESFLSIQSDSWLLEFYKFLLSGQNALWCRPSERGDSGGPLRSKPIIRLQDNEHVRPFEKDGTTPRVNRHVKPFEDDGTTPRVFLPPPPPEETDFLIVKRSIADDEQARNFLKSLGLSEPDVFDDIVKKVLPKYSKSDVSSISEAEHNADICKIRRALTSDSESGKKKVIQAAKQTPFLRAVNLAKEEEAFKKPCDVYQESETLRRYFTASTDVWFLSEKTLAVDSNVLSELGIETLPRRIQSSGDLPDGTRERPASTEKTEKIENYNLHGLDDFLKSLETIQSFEVKADAVLILWRYLQEHLKLDPRFFEGRYYWRYYKDHSKSFPSQMLTDLQKAKWIPTRTKSMEKPGDINTDQLFDGFQEAEELIKALGINHGNMQGVSTEDIEFIKKFPDEFAQLKAKLNAKINSGNDSPEFPTRAVANPERRQGRVEEQISESPKKEYEKCEISVRTSRSDIDPSQWLKGQYTDGDRQMVCQICKDKMPFKKRDGEYYFEAVEAFSKDHFPLEHEAQFLALCPLCAAMYKEFVKRDDKAMTELVEALLKNASMEVPLQPGVWKKPTIRFVETHFHDLKVILQRKSKEKGMSEGSLQEGRTGEEV